ncbi:MAG: tryptophan-rich sensory protein, partial [Myxococcota bacterium]
MSNTLRSWINVFWLLLVLAINAISNILPLNGLSQRELSELYPIMLTPAPFVFSIWGIIYLGLLIYTILQLMPPFRDNPRIRSLDLPFALSCVFNSAWILIS